MSQQPAKERRPEQLESQVNCTSSVINGLGRRPGTVELEQYATTVFPGGNDTAFHAYDRGDELERYLIGVSDGDITVLDLFTGDKPTVNMVASSAYLAMTDPTKQMKFHTIADTTLMVNTSIVPTTGVPTDDDTEFDVMIYLKRANWGKDYVISIDGVVQATYTTPATLSLPTATEVSKAITLKTTDVISSLHTSLGTWAAAEGVTLTLSGDVIRMYKATGSYVVTTEDDTNGSDLIPIGQVLGSYSDLPKIAPNNFKVKISGADNSGDNDYYVQFRSDFGADFGVGAWEESAGFGVDTEFTASTMPHVLIRQASGEFDFMQETWDARDAGDDTSNPAPSFVGVGISDILTYQGRIVLTTEENQCASVTFEHFNFWANSVLAQSADDPIDTASSDNQVTNLQHSLVFNASLVTFSDQAQFVHSGDNRFTSDTFSLASKSRFTTNINCKPVASATSIFFPYTFGLYTGVREFSIDDISGNILSDSITGHVKKYLDGSATQIDSSTDYNMVVVKTDGATTALYIYEWFTSDGKRVQSAWHKWDIGADIKYVKILQNKMYLVILRGDKYSIEYIDLSDQNANAMTFPVRLDLQEELEAVSITDYWQITPTISNFSTVALSDLVVIAGDNTQLAGREVNYTVSGSTLLISKDTVQQVGDLPKFYVGIPYTSVAEITNPFVRDQLGKTKTKGLLKLGTMRFNLSDTGYISIQVTTPVDTFDQVYTGSIVDSEDFVLDAPPTIKDDTLSVPIRTYRDRCSITLTSSSHLPFNVSDIDWSGTYYESGTRTR